MCLRPIPTVLYSLLTVALLPCFHHDIRVDGRWLFEKRQQPVLRLTGDVETGKGGFVVDTVTADGPAEKLNSMMDAGKTYKLKPGDVITAVSGVTPLDLRDFQDLLLYSVKENNNKAIISVRESGANSVKSFMVVPEMVEVEVPARTKELNISEILIPPTASAGPPPNVPATLSERQQGSTLDDDDPEAVLEAAKKTLESRRAMVRFHNHVQSPAVTYKLRWLTWQGKWTDWEERTLGSGSTWNYWMDGGVDCEIEFDSGNGMKRYHLYVTMFHTTEDHKNIRITIHTFERNGGTLDLIAK